jgi:hypothetical protein
MEQETWREGVGWGMNEDREFVCSLFSSIPLFPKTNPFGFGVV